LEKDKAGETMWLPCEVFDEVAKDNIESFRKGSKIHLVGSLLFNKWIDKNNGEERKQFRFRIKKVLSELQFKKMNTFLEYEDLMISDHSKLLQPRPPQKLNYPQERIQMQEPVENNQNILPPTIKRSKRMMKTKSSQHESETSAPSKELPLELETSNFVEMSLPIIETPAPVIPRFLPVAPSSIPPKSSPPTVQSPAMLAASSSDSSSASVQLDGPDTSQINGERERDATNNPWNREDSWDNVEREIRESRVKNKATNKFI
jgi:single-stranded DNA-binding protein